MATDDDAPQKYIRTFAGDMEVIKEGRQPDLAPFDENQDTVVHATPVQTPAARPVETPEKMLDKMAEIATPVPPPLPVSPPAYTYDEQERGEVLARLRAARLAQKQILQREADLPSPIHTYSEDFSDQVKEEHASTASILAAEQDAAPRPVALSINTAEPHKILYLGIGAVLLIGGGIGVYYAYSQYVIKSAPVVIAPTHKAPIIVDDQREVTGEGAVLLAAIQKSVAEPLAASSIRLLYSDSATTTRRSIFVTLAPPAPNILLRNIQGTGSMAGVINVKGAQSPFFILSVSSYNDTFSGLLSWEPTMASNLVGLFSAYLEPAPAATTTPADPAATKQKPGTKKQPQAAATVTPVVVVAPAFHDETVANHDVRVYRDNAGRSVLLYGYWNKTTLIIARDPDAFSEIIGRLANARTQSL